MDTSYIFMKKNQNIIILFQRPKEDSCFSGGYTVAGLIARILTSLDEVEPLRG